MRSWQWFVQAVLAGLALSGGALAGEVPDESKQVSAPRPFDRDQLDLRAYAALSELHQNGRELYNDDKPAACSYLFEGGLSTLYSLLDHRPDLQKFIANGLAKAQQQQDMAWRAWALHELVIDVRFRVRPKMPGLMPRKGDTLWDRLGGEDNVTLILDDFLKDVLDSRTINFARDRKFLNTAEQRA